MSWDIRFETAGNTYQLQMMAECQIEKSVDNLTDTATIVLPASVMNETLAFNGKIKRGSSVKIRLGYDNNLINEFSGFVKDITTNDSSLQINCEDALFLFRKGVGNLEMKDVVLKDVAQYVLNELNPEFSLDCNYSVGYEKFTVYKATGFVVLKKIQEETGANVYFDTENKVLHIHPPYSEVGNDVYYSYQHNIEEGASLEFKTRQDYKAEIIIESTDKNGNVRKVKAGTPGGDKISFKKGPLTKESMQKIADEELKKQTAAGYEGDFPAWLVPYVQTGDQVRIKDEDYPEKTGFYFAKAVKTSFTNNGGERKITPGIKLS